MSDQKQAGASGAVLAALMIIALGLAGSGKLMASGEEQLLAEVAQLAAESPLTPSVVDEPDELVEVGTRAPSKPPTAPGIVAPGTSADLAVQRAVQFLMSKGAVVEGRRLLEMLAARQVRVGPGTVGWMGVAVPRACAELTPAEERDPDRGMPRTIALARALLIGLFLQPDAQGLTPTAASAWTHTLEAMSSWVRGATLKVEKAGAGDGDPKLATWRALVLVESMRAALRDYADLGWCGDGRGPAWKALAETLDRTRTLLKRKLGEQV